ncbi:ElyC/SanA/YdcF family protein [Adlercreutzia sp. ZJ304]|uniref:SanA/YdcF family protein n=1 Tax=Adlercreutzia sp. ZJ304 TaxID=2709791 RepID=UPI00197E9135|nr:ElyC/SanA/YdcF family protein [Adlercreutzia sp. ZJ304]
MGDARRGCMRAKRKWLKVLGIACTAVVIVVAAAALAIDAHVRTSTESRIISSNEAARMDNIDCVLVLGCGVNADGSPSDMLADRLKQGISLYGHNVAPKILMSGDHGSQDYNEVGTMKAIAINAGIPSKDVFMDHAGFSTYESMYRARDIFQAKRIIVVSQSYHLFRALYVAEKLGLDAYGVASDLRPYAGQMMRDVREVLARNKDFVTAIVRPAPTFQGSSIPLTGSGDETND